MRLLAAFFRQHFYSLTAYRTSFWMTIMNTFIKIYAYAMLWTILFQTRGDLFAITLPQILTYSTASVALSQTFTWWDGPHIYVANNVRKGNIILDLFRPIDFELHMFVRGFSNALVNFCLYTIPTFLVASVFFHVRLFHDVHHVIVFLVSVFLGYLVLFCLNFLFALLSFITLELSGYLHAYHGIIAFFSGQLIPLWIFPGYLQRILDVLPFKSVFYIPLSIFIRDINGVDVYNSMLFQAFWVLILFLIGRLLWKVSLKRTVVQGG